MKEKFKENGINILNVYYCPHGPEDNCECRKPKIGMIQQAIADFPDILLNNSFLIGDTESDIKLAQQAGIKSILINEKNQFGADYNFSSLYYAAVFITENY